jgi:hypothetical protein
VQKTILGWLIQGLHLLYWIFHKTIDAWFFEKMVHWLAKPLEQAMTDSLLRVGVPTLLILVTVWLWWPQILLRIRRRAPSSESSHAKVVVQSEPLSNKLARYSLWRDDNNRLSSEATRYGNQLHDCYMNFGDPSTDRNGLVFSDHKRMVNRARDGWDRVMRDAQVAFSKWGYEDLKPQERPNIARNPEWQPHNHKELPFRDIDHEFRAFKDERDNAIRCLRVADERLSAEIKSVERAIRG